jgi:multisubunit Na+/H+ antiporter MnhB subunit
MVYELFEFTEKLKLFIFPFLPVFHVKTRSLSLLCYIYYCLSATYLFLLLYTLQISHYKVSVSLEECHPVNITSSFQNVQRNIIFSGGVVFF